MFVFFFRKELRFKDKYEKKNIVYLPSSSCTVFVDENALQLTEPISNLKNLISVGCGNGFLYAQSKTEI